MKNNKKGNFKEAAASANNYFRVRVRNSSRLFGSSRNTPSMQLVTVFAPGFWTPLMTMHMCLESSEFF